MTGYRSLEAMARARPLTLRPSAVPLTLVCGPCAAGKSTHVASMAATGDVIIDLDLIAGEMVGRKLQRVKSGALLEAALKERNRRLKALSTLPARDGVSAWFIVAAPDAAERGWWVRQLRPVAVAIVATPIEVCLGRIGHDDDRAEGREQMRQWATEWWATYRRTGGCGAGEREIVAAAGTM